MTKPGFAGSRVDMSPEAVGARIGEVGRLSEELRADRRLPHRIAGGAIVVREQRILLVRYAEGDGTTFLVAPGGGAQEEESVADAAVRETLEETGLVVTPGRVLLIEDIVASRFKMCKVWLSCAEVSGAVHRTEGARIEGILEAGWFSREDLEHEKVFPWIVKGCPWESFRSADYAVPVSPPRRATF